MNYRYRCTCGNVYDSPHEAAVCPSCQTENSTEGNGIVQIYRMGNYIGCAVGMLLYVDEEPFGRVSNKGSIKLVVPYGEHQLHATLSTFRESTQPVINLSPETPELYFKVETPVFGGKIGGSGCDCCFSAPDITLQQPVHRFTAAEVLADRPYGFLLRGCQ